MTEEEEQFWCILATLKSYAECIRVYQTDPANENYQAWLTFIAGSLDQAAIRLEEIVPPFPGATMTLVSLPAGDAAGERTP